MEITLNANNKNWEFDRTKLKQVRKLGQGHFGVVFEGEAYNLVPGKPSCRVAVKMLSEDTEEALDDFMKETEIMK